MNLEKTIKRGSTILKENNINSHLLDAELILSNIIGVDRELLCLKNNFTISKKILDKYISRIKRRTKKEPVAYIIGKKEFWNDNFLVNRSTLIPRPETELLIYKVINFFKNKTINILDIGTGSGCILLSILKELPFARGLGIDISGKAIRTAIRNSNKLNLLNRSKFKVSDINKFNSGKYNLIVSNPPYIPCNDIRKLSRDIINFEPLIALNGGSDGLDLIKKVIYKSNILLKKNGLLVIEIGFGQYKKVSNILKQQRFREVYKVYDNNKNVRCIMSTKADYL